MKNIHLIPTDKPSRLYSKDGNHILDTTMAIDWYISSAGYKPHNIYITSDEEIKKDEYYLGEDNNIYCLVTTVNFNGKKIILTTDQDLINDGVQGIDDEFLNWFIKNPGCEEIEVFQEKHHAGEVVDESYPKGFFDYKILIPKEEPKQETLEQIDQNNPITRGSTALVYKQETLEEEPKQITSLDGDVLGGIPKGILTMLIGEKEETLKEAAEKYVEINVAKNAAKLMYKEHFIAGAKWQQQRSYSGEEAFNLLMEFSSRDRNSSSGTPHSIAKWFEQFKK